MAVFKILTHLQKIRNLARYTAQVGITKESNRTYDNGATTAEVGLKFVQGSALEGIAKCDFLIEGFTFRKKYYSKILIDAIKNKSFFKCPQRPFNELGD